MSHQFVTVNWNRRKRIYDLCLWFGIVTYIVLFVLVTNLRFHGDAAITPVIVLIRAFATCGFLMLTLILCIGPLARIDSRFLPLLYNRRHFGVSMFVIALTHASLAIFWYHSFGPVNPIVSVVTSGGSYENPGDVPFQAFGLVALLILFSMAATSHDYWNAVLGRLWKTLHIMLYPAYVLLVLHIGFGAMQEDNTGILPVMVIASVAIVGGLHIYSALFASSADQRILDNDRGNNQGNDWIKVGSWRHIKNNCAVTIDISSDERVAVFRYDDDKLCAVSNVCQHQNGPLGEGRVIDGCITCPWHGYQYRPEDGRSPPPFNETIETYELKLDGETVLLNPKPLGKGIARPVTEIKPKEHPLQ